MSKQLFAKACINTATHRCLCRITNRKRFSEIALQIQWTEWIMGSHTSYNALAQISDTVQRWNRRTFTCTWVCCPCIEYYCLSSKILLLLSTLYLNWKCLKGDPPIVFPPRLSDFGSLCDFSSFRIIRFWKYQTVAEFKANKWMKKSENWNK